MAILTKRRSTSTLPEVTSDRGLLVSQRPSDLMGKTSGCPSKGGPAKKVPSKGVSTSPITSKTTTAVRPSAALTSAVKGTTPTTTGGKKSTGAAGAPKTTTLTTKLAGTERPTLTKKKATTSGASKLTSALSGALLGAGAGVAGKAVYDKLFGTKKEKGDAPNSSKNTDGAKSPDVKRKTPDNNKKNPGAKENNIKTETNSTAGAGVVGPTTRKNEDGTYTQSFDNGSTITYDKDGNVISSTPATDTEDVTNYTKDTTEEDIYGGRQNEDGTITYTMFDGSTITVDASGNVIGSTDKNDNTIDVTKEKTGYYEDDDGNLYDADGNLIYDSYAGMLTSDKGYDAYYNDINSGVGKDVEEDVYENVEEEVSDEEEDYEDNYGYEYEYEPPGEKRGGLITMMNRGGDVRAFENGGDEGEPVEDDSPMVTSAFVDQDAADTEYFYDGSYIVHYSDGSSITYDSDGEIYQVDGDEGSEANTAVEVVRSFNQRGGLEDETSGGTAGTTYGGNVHVFDDGSRIERFDDGTNITYDRDGNIFSTTDRDGNVIRMSDIANVGTGSVRDYYKIFPKPQTPKEPNKNGTAKSALDEFIESVKGSGYLGAGAAGAALGALLSNADLFGGGTQERNAGIDMSKVGLIPARTTEFGFGPAKYVTYDEYGARDQMPDLYGTELYRNLNAPGFNPVREGDYGYAEETQGTVEPTEGETEEVAKENKMAVGGMPDSETYFTFGRPVDPLQNINNPQYAAPAPGGLGSQQIKPQMPLPQTGLVMPQMTQPMKQGGLPAVSSVPLARGRLDFREGASVHGPGDGQSDDIPAMLADGEYVIDAETVAQIGNGSTKAGAKALDEFRQNIRKHKRSAPLNKIPPKSKPLTSYLKKGN